MMKNEGQEDYKAAEVTAEFVGRRLKAEREAKGLSLPEAAMRATLSTEQVMKLEGGFDDAPVDDILKLCAGLGIRPTTPFADSRVAEFYERISTMDPTAITEVTRLLVGVTLLCALGPPAIDHARQVFGAIVGLLAAPEESPL